MGWRRAVLGGYVYGWRLSHKRCGVSFPVSRGGLSATGGMMGKMGVEWGMEQRDLAEQESGEREHTELNPG